MNKHFTEYKGRDKLILISPFYTVCFGVRRAFFLFRRVMKTMLHIHYGNGKGKSSAAFGMALRMIGHGKRVLLVSFLKDGNSGELLAFQSFENMKQMSRKMPETFWFQMTKEEQATTALDQYLLYKEMLALLPSFDMVILDEILDLKTLGILNDQQIRNDLASISDQEIILTGRSADQELLTRADYVTEFTSHKHPYVKGVQAREGVEF